MEFNQIQIALFVSPLIERPDKMFYKISESTPGIFEKSPTILPVDDNVPADFPIVQATCQKTSLRLNISRNRIDVFQQAIALNDRFETIRYIIKQILNKNEEYKIVRMGVVLQYFKKDSTPSKTISKRYLKQDDNYSGVTISYTKAISLSNVICNDTVLIQEAVLSTLANKNPVVFLQRDINIKDVHENGYSRSKIESIIEQSILKSDSETMSRYING